MPRSAINESIDKSYHQVTPTLPFSKDFTEKYKLKFLKNYVLNKERLKKVLPVQMKHFTEEELNQRYSSYFASKINSLQDVLKMAGIKDSELPIKCLDEKDIIIPNLEKKIKKMFPVKNIKKNAFKILLINISTHFTSEKDISEYDVLEPPLGLIALQTYLDHIFKEDIEGKLIKSRIDFDSYEKLNSIIDEFNPDLIGVSAMTFHKNFFHQAIKKIREHGYKKMLIVGGPHPTTSYNEVLKDTNIDACVIGEGEITLSEIISSMMQNKNQKLISRDLKKINGLAFIDKNENNKKFTKVQEDISNSSANGLYSNSKIVGQY